MLPGALGLPAALFLILGGAVACFAGYRMFRLVLGVYGFLLGSMLASSVVGVTNTTGMVVAALGGGVAGALLLMLGYFIGVALVGAGMGALAAHLTWPLAGSGDPPVLLIVGLAMVGAVGATFVQRYIVIAGTAFGGAWTMVVGVVNLLAERGVTRGSSDTDVWILYPTTIGDTTWAPLAWIVLSVAGLSVQLAGKKKRK